MSGSKPGEMAPESSQAMVMLKFDMHIYTSTLTIKELKEATTEYCIPTDLHPRLPPPKLTMDKLPPKYIGIYIEQLEQGGLRIPFSTFFLPVIKHIGVHISQLVPMGMNRVILFEIRCRSLNINTTGWKKKFFLIDRRAIPDAMPWLHIDSNVRDDFLTNCNKGDAERLAEFTIPLRPPPRHLLFVCGLTKTCRHPKLSYSIKDPDRKVLNMDDFLKLLVWNGTVVSKGDPIPDNQHPPLRTTPPLEVGKLISKKSSVQRSIEKPNSKIAAAREKKDQQNLAKAQANHAGEGVAPKLVDETTTSIQKDITRNVAIGSQTANVEREDFLSELLNVEVVRHAYQSLGRCVLSQGKERELLDKLKDIERERDDWRQTASEQVEMIKKLEETLEPKSKQLADAEGRIKVLEGEKTTLKSLAVPIGLCFAAGWLGGLSLGMKQEEIAAMLSETSNLDIEGSKAWKDKHRKLFTKQYPYVQKVADSYRLLVDALMKISPDVPPLAANYGTEPSTKNNDDGTTIQTSLKVQTVKTATGAPLKMAI
ncbi:hypothetical protein Tco_0277856 [Tanacetum coccineum]